VDTTEKSLRILSLCSGVRGLERGIERALEGSGQQLDTVAYVEIEAFIVANLIAGMEAGVLAPRPVWTDLKTFPYESFYGKIHGFVGGYPCQPFSNAGNRGGEEDPRHLWPYIAKGIGAVRPLWCFFENVPGHLTLGYETVRRELQELGYRVKEGIFSAEEVGAPHIRERLFILAILEHTNNSGSGTSKCFVNKYWKKNSQKRKHTFCGSCRPSKEMDNSSSYRPEQVNEISTRRNSVEYAGERLANANSSRSGKDTELCKLWTGRTVKPSGYSWGGDKRKESEIRQRRQFPARPEEPQYDWEEKRTVESGMGCTIDGYNFREDLLRAYGNGVVDATSELAFITLLEEHLNNN
jgi:DNA (cytosine-5)-methyltransferase 1